MHETRNTITLIKPAAMWRFMCERRITIAHAHKFLLTHGIEISDPTLRNWFSEDAMRERGDNLPARWAEAEPVLARMVGQS